MDQSVKSSAPYFTYSVVYIDGKQKPFAMIFRLNMSISNPKAKNTYNHARA
jgi:hypothetical protein